METVSRLEEPSAATERLAYSIEEAAAMLGVHYFSVYRLIQRGKLKPVPGAARQTPCAPLRTAQIVECRMSTARQ